MTIANIREINIETCSDADFDAHLSMEDELHAQALMNLDLEMGINPNADKYSNRRP